MDDFGKSTSRRRSLNLQNDDFGDVFGGPPGIVLNRRSSLRFYDEVFSPPSSRSRRGGRNLPALDIPLPSNSRKSLGTKTEDGFYDDIFRSDVSSSGSQERRRSRTMSIPGSYKSKSTSSSSDRDSNHDATLSSFASKLRPITIPTRDQDSLQPSSVSGIGQSSSNWTLPIDNIHFSRFVDVADTDIYCPNCRTKSIVFPKKLVAEAKGEYMRETEGANAVDEAIAWASERFWNHKSSLELIECTEEVNSRSVDSMLLKEEPSSDSTFVYNEGND